MNLGMLRRALPLYQRLIGVTQREFSFFNKQISDKYGKKCCRYHQDGKPLSANKAEQIKSSVEDFLKGWSFDTEHKKLIRYFFIEDYILGVQFIKDIAKIDALNF